MALLLQHQQGVLTEHNEISNMNEDEDFGETGDEAPLRVYPQVNLYKGSSVVYSTAVVEDDNELPQLESMEEISLSEDSDSTVDGMRIMPIPPVAFFSSQNIGQNHAAPPPPPPPRSGEKQIPPPPPPAGIHLEGGLLQSPLCRKPSWKVELERREVVETLFARYAGRVLDAIAAGKLKISSDIERDNIYGVIRIVFEGGFTSLIKHLDRRCQQLYVHLQSTTLPHSLINSATERLKSRIFNLCSDLSKSHRNAVSFLESSVIFRSYIPSELKSQIKIILSEGRPSVVVGELTSVAEQLPILDSTESVATFTV